MVARFEAVLLLRPSPPSGDARVCIQLTFDHVCVYVQPADTLHDYISLAWTAGCVAEGEREARVVYVRRAHQHASSPLSAPLWERVLPKWCARRVASAHPRGRDDVVAELRVLFDERAQRDAFCMSLRSHLKLFWSGGPSTSASASTSASTSAAPASPRVRRMLVFVNPFSGAKRGRQIYDDVLAPILEAAAEPRVQVLMVETEREGHAADIVLGREVTPVSAGGRVLDVLRDVDAIVCVSGDGLLHEVLQALAQLPQRAQALRIPLGIVYGGTGNGLAVSLGLRNAALASLYIAHGSLRAVDLMRTTVGSKEYLVVNGMGWVIPANVNHVTDSRLYRLLGVARKQLAAFVEVMRYPEYAARVRMETVDGRQIDLDDKFVFFTVSNVPHVHFDMHLDPAVQVDSGYVSVTAVPTGPARLTLLERFVRVRWAGHTDGNGRSFVHQYHVRRCVLEPRARTPPSVYSIDGIITPAERMVVDVLPSAVQVFGPARGMRPLVPE